MTVNGSGKAKSATRSTTAAVAGQRVEQVVDDGRMRLAGRPPGAAQRGRGQPAQPGVVGRVDAEHVPCEGRAGQPLGDDRAVARERGVHVLGQPRVVERRAGLGVADDQPGRVPVGQRHFVHRPVGADPANSGNGSSRS